MDLNRYTIFAMPDGRFAVRHETAFVWNGRKSKSAYTYGIRFDDADSAEEWILATDPTPSCDIVRIHETVTTHQKA